MIISFVSSFLREVAGEVALMGNVVQIESTGQFDADELFLSAVGVLKAKCSALKRETHRMLKKQALDARSGSGDAGPKKGDRGWTAQ